MLGRPSSRADESPNPTNCASGYSHVYISFTVGFDGGDVRAGVDGGDVRAGVDGGDVRAGVDADEDEDEDEDGDAEFLRAISAAAAFFAAANLAAKLLS